MYIYMHIALVSKISIAVKSLNELFLKLFILK